LYIHTYIHSTAQHMLLLLLKVLGDLAPAAGLDCTVQE
jgi:hypothetical protein